MTKRGNHGGNNSFGALKGKITRYANERIKEYQAEELLRIKLEIEQNKERFKTALINLKEIDPDIDSWYDSDAVPEWISWRGDAFEQTLKIITDRIQLLGENND